jgi:hypothetical protein
MSFTIEPVEIDQTVPVSNPEARRILGIEHCGDPDQAARRMIRQGVPHLRIGRRIRFSLPALKKWAAERINNSIAASAAITE